MCFLVYLQAQRPLLQAYNSNGKISVTVVSDTIRNPSGGAGNILGKEIKCHPSVTAKIIAKMKAKTYSAIGQVGSEDSWKSFTDEIPKVTVGPPSALERSGKSSIPVRITKRDHTFIEIRK